MRPSGPAERAGWRYSSMSTALKTVATDLAKGLSIFEIDESLAALVDAAEEDAETNNGEVSEPIKEALSAYAEAFGYKVDRIADFLKAQRAEAEIAQREGERFQARHKAAENREKRLNRCSSGSCSRGRCKTARRVEYNLPPGEQRSVAGPPRNDPHTSHFLSSTDRDHMAGVDRGIGCPTGRTLARQADEF